MKNKEIKKLSIDELKNKVNSLKKDVARLLTALNQKNWYEQKNIKWQSY